MGKLMVFEGLRMRNTNRMLFLAIAYFITGLSGVLIGTLYTDKGMTSIDIFLFIISAFNQFVFIFISYFFIISITSDFEQHIFLMYRQYEISLKKVVVSKILLNVLISIACTFLIIISAFLLMGLNSYKLLFSSIIEVFLAVIFSVLFSSTIALMCKKTMLAFIINFIGFILFNIGNLVFQGVLSPADVNGLPFSALRLIAGRPIVRNTELVNTIPFLQTNPLLVLVGSGVISCIIIAVFLVITYRKSIAFK